jgi:hypothetical protein
MVSGKVLLLVGAAALLPTLAGQVSAQSPALATQPFSPPDAPQVLTRTVWRTLADGKQIVVRRRYAVRFTRQGDGFLLDGQLLDAAVEAPPMLAPLAELERRRSDNGLFPMLLDAAGRIRSGANPEAANPAAHDNARAQSQGMLAATPLASAQRQESTAFLNQLAAQGMPAGWPVDLFNPASAERSEHRRIALPSGLEGEVTVSIKVVGIHSHGMPNAVERTVTTVMAGNARTSREQWTLAPVDHVKP